MDKRLETVTGQHVNRRKVIGGVGVAAAVPVVAAVGGLNRGVSAKQDLTAEANAIITERELSPEDVTAALETYMPSGRMDDYMMFTSSGHAGMVYAIGVPSMRNYKSIAVFTPEP